MLMKIFKTKPSILNNKYDKKIKVKDPLNIKKRKRIKSCSIVNSKSMKFINLFNTLDKFKLS